MPLFAHAQWLSNVISPAEIDRETSDVLMSDDVVIADATIEPLDLNMKIMGWGVDRPATLRIVKSYKGVLKEQTTTSASLGWPFNTIFHFTNRQVAEIEPTTLEGKTYHLRKKDGASTSGRYLLFLQKHSASGPKSYEWRTWHGEVTAVIPLNKSLPLDTTGTKTMSESIAVLVHREWERASAAGELAPVKNANAVRR